MRSYQVLWTDNALDDLETIIGYIYADNKTNAKEIYTEIKERVRSLDKFPFRGRVVPELETLGYQYYRELIFKRWRMVYLIEDSTVYMLLILDSRQDLEDQLIKRILNNK